MGRRVRLAREDRGTGTDKQHPPAPVKGSSHRLSRVNRNPRPRCEITGGSPRFLRRVMDGEQFTGWGKRIGRLAVCLTSLACFPAGTYTQMTTP